MSLFKLLDELAGRGIKVVVQTDFPPKHVEIRVGDMAYVYRTGIATEDEIVMQIKQIVFDTYEERL